MNTESVATAVQPVVFQHNMPNVIDSLKPLERIGSDESQTVKKILEAASELSQCICEHFPTGLRGRYISGSVLKDGTVRVGFDHGSSNNKYDFGHYAVATKDLEHLGGLRVLGDDRKPRVVGADRETALRFSKDIANGLLDLICQFIETEHKESKKALGDLTKAAEGLKDFGQPS